MIEDIELLGHSSIKLNKEKIIYFDPFKIEKNYNDADLIFITHSHYDHFSEEDILKVKKDNTVIVLTFDLIEKAKELGFNSENIIPVKPGMDLEVFGIKFSTIPAYNINKQFHPKQNDWVGYKVNVGQTVYYVAGDTDETPENSLVKCDIALVPVGGTYTMTAKEAAHLINNIKPKIAIPIHYGSIVGTIDDAKEFIELLDDNIEGKILMK